MNWFEISMVCPTIKDKSQGLSFFCAVPFLKNITNYYNDEETITWLNCHDHTGIDWL